MNTLVFLIKDQSLMAQSMSSHRAPLTLSACNPKASTINSNNQDIVPPKNLKLPIIEPLRLSITEPRCTQKEYLQKTSLGPTSMKTITNHHQDPVNQDISQNLRLLIPRHSQPVFRNPATNSHKPPPATTERQRSSETKSLNTSVISP